MSLKMNIAKSLVMAVTLLSLQGCLDAKEHKDTSKIAQKQEVKKDDAAKADSAKKSDEAPDAKINESVETKLGEGVTEDVKNNIINGMKTNLTGGGEAGVSFTSIDKTPIDNLYQVVLNKHEVVYATGDGKFVIIGTMIDLANKVDLTKAVVAELNKVDISKLPLKNAFVTKLGKGERKLYVFADPDCPFCERLQKTLLGMDNVTVYTFLMGLTEIHPMAHEHAKLILCQKDPAAAWNKWVESDENVKSIGKPVKDLKKCEKILDENQALSDEIGVSGTPTIIFENGHKVSGALPKESLDKLLDAAHKDAAEKKSKKK